MVLPVGDAQQIEVFDERQAVGYIQAVWGVHICVKEGDTPSNETYMSDTMIQCPLEGDRSATRYKLSQQPYVNDTMCVLSLIHI